MVGGVKNVSLTCLPARALGPQGGVVLATEATHAAFKVSREAARRGLHRAQLLHVGPPRRREGAAAGPGRGAGAVADATDSARATPVGAMHSCLASATATATAAAGSSQDPVLHGDLFCVLDTRLLPRHGFSQPFRCDGRSAFLPLAYHEVPYGLLHMQHA